MTTTSAPGGAVFDRIPGHAGAVAELRAAVASPVHAYLLVGPAGAGARVAAEALAAALLCAEGGCGRCRTCRLVLAGEHPDAGSFAPSGVGLSKEQIDEVIRLSLRSPLEGDRKVLLLHDLHQIGPNAPRLLKTIEEPPPGTFFVIVAEHVPRELVTISSRCVRIDLPPLPGTEVESLLLAEGADPSAAAAAAASSLGDLDRARLLLTDEEVGARRDAWGGVPRRLDGTGAAVAVVAADLLQLLDGAAAPLQAAIDAEVAALDERAALYGEKGSKRRALEAEHKRRLRRHRTGELRFGLGVLAGRYRDALVGGGSGVDAQRCAAAVGAVDEASEALTRNPNEPLLLQSLLLRLPALA